MDTETASFHSDGAAETRATREPDRSDGIFGTWAGLSVGMAESTVRAASRFFRAAFGESQKAADATLDWSEETQKAVLRTGRHLSRACFELLTEAVSRSEQACLVVLRQSQRTGDRASELASQASHAVIGSRGLNGHSTISR